MSVSLFDFISSRIKVQEPVMENNPIVLRPDDILTQKIEESEGNNQINEPKGADNKPKRAKAKKPKKEKTTTETTKTKKRTKKTEQDATVLESDTTTKAN